MPSIRVKENEPFEVAMRRFKRSIEKTGLLTELRAREAYEKPTTERKRKKAAAVKRLQKRPYRIVERPSARVPADSGQRQCRMPLLRHGLPFGRRPSPPPRTTLISKNKMNAKPQVTPIDRPKLTLPNGADKLLLHSCCAPCSGEVMEALLASDIDYTIYFYNPNIHPLKEYEIRKEENIRFAEKHGVPFIDADYDVDNWFERAKGMEYEPERGIRCTMCFDMRFERTALYAHEHGFKVISSSLGISRWKNMAQINDCGHRAAAHYPGIVYWDFNWRKGGGSARMIEISKREHFYQQEYCGCAYSLRDTNAWRREKGREPIKIGVKYYGDDDDE